MNQAPAANGGLTHDQLQQLNQRFRCKKDLYTYLDKVMQIYLPSMKNCSVQVSCFAIILLTQLSPHLHMRIWLWILAGIMR